VFINEGKTISVESAAAVAERARRLVRVTFASEGGAPSNLAAALARLKSGRATLHGSLALVELDQSDPREFLAELAASRDLPAPIAIEYGKTSLQDLYRGLYGLEAC
jgi:hypothetical protein